MTHEPSASGWLARNRAEVHSFVVSILLFLVYVGLSLFLTHIDPAGANWAIALSWVPATMLAAAVFTTGMMKGRDLIFPWLRVSMFRVLAPIFPIVMELFLYYT